MLFKDDVVVVVIKQDGDGAELGGGAARLGDFIWLQEVDLWQHSDTWLTLTHSHVQSTVLVRLVCRHQY